MNSHRSVIPPICLAAVLWFLMFSPWTAPHLPFWWSMAASACILTTLALARGGKECLGTELTRSSFFLGAAIAVMLWCVFWLGDKVSQWMFAFARPQVELVYGMKEGQSPLLVSLLLLFIIGPAEEIFWRGYVQRTLSGRLSPMAAFVVTTAVYTLVHIPSGNFMLVMAALTCGLAWGGLYLIMPRRLPAIIISHALWDAAAFVWFPF